MGNPEVQGCYNPLGQPSANARWSGWVNIYKHFSLSSLGSLRDILYSDSEVPVGIKAQLPTAVTNVAGLVLLPSLASLRSPSLLLSQITCHSQPPTPCLSLFFLGKLRQHVLLYSQNTFTYC